MPAPAPPPTPSKVPARDPTPRGAPLRLSRMALMVIAAAFAVGLLLFLMLWIDQRNDKDFFRSNGTLPTATDQVFEPLPAPVPAEAADDVAGMQDRDIGERFPQRVEPAFEPATPLPEPAPPPPPAPYPQASMAPGTTPVPVDAPAPRYPPAALRRAESGTVLLRVHVGTDGRPYAVDIIESSRSRLLDRAASEGVKRWRFLPAQRDGQPVSGQVQVPISFDAKR